MKYSPTIFAAFAAALVSGCASAPEVKYDSSAGSATEFAKQVVNDTQKGVQRYSSRLSFKESKDGNLNLFEAVFWPDAGSEAIDSSFSNYCAGIGGEFRDGLCSYDSELNGHFFVEYIPTGQVVGGTQQLRMRVAEGNQYSGQEVIRFAQRRGYKTRAESLIERSTALNAEQRRLDQVEQEIATRKRYSEETRALVLEKGTRVGPVDPNEFLCNKYKCYTEDSNPNTGRIKITVLNNTRWLDASMWYACE